MTSELKYRKILQEQRNKGSITKFYYEKELELIKEMKEIKKTRNEKITKNRPKEPIQMVEARNNTNITLSYLKPISNGPTRSIRVIRQSIRRRINKTSRN